MTLDNALDQLAIRNLLARMVHLADSGSLEDYKELYAADAVWEVKNGQKLVGHAAIVEGARQRWDKKFTGPGSNTRHVLSSVDVSVEGERAMAKSVLQFYTNIHQKPELSAIAVYEDTFQKIDGRWWVKTRLIDALNS